MKRTPKHLTSILLLIIQLIACEKKPVVVPPVQEGVCQITQMTYNVYNLSTTPSTATFKYNSMGKPVSVHVSNVSVGNPHVLFLYDKYNRLTDYIGTYGSNTDPANMPAEFLYEFWIRYAYVDQNPSSLPVGDTSRFNGFYKDEKINSIAISTGNLLYDSQGRLTTGGRRYDANGNLINPSATYDNKTNFRQTNKVWMFIDNNYSVNNAYTALTYNNAELPTTFPNPVPPRVYQDDFLHRQMNISTMKYSCSIVPSGQ